MYTELTIRKARNGYIVQVQCETFVVECDALTLGVYVRNFFESHETQQELIKQYAPEHYAKEYVVDPFLQQPIR